MKDDGFNSHCISHAKHLFYEMVSPKTHGQVCLDQKQYQYALLVSFTSTTPPITTATNTGKSFFSILKVTESLYHKVTVVILCFVTANL